jgi:hypothetical protein
VRDVAAEERRYLVGDEVEDLARAARHARRVSPRPATRPCSSAIAARARSGTTARR